MAEKEQQTPRTRAVPPWGISMIAGAEAGVVAALASVGAEALMHRQVLAQAQTLWSAFAAGILGGILYGWLARVARRPVVALWVITLTDATMGSFLIVMLPLASGPNSLLTSHFVGFVGPLRQLLATLGVEHVGTRYFPASPVAVTITLYISAVAVSLLVPHWAKPKDGARRPYRHAN